jgi:hypothetical protein
MPNVAGRIAFLIQRPRRPLSIILALILRQPSQPELHPGLSSAKFSRPYGAQIRDGEPIISGLGGGGCGLLNVRPDLRGLLGLGLGHRTGAPLLRAGYYRLDAP